MHGYFNLGMVILLLPFVILLYARKHAPQADLEETERVPARVAGEGRGWER